MRWTGLLAVSTACALACGGGGGAGGPPDAADDVEVGGTSDPGGDPSPDPGAPKDARDAADPGAGTDPGTGTDPSPEGPADPGPETADVATDPGPDLPMTLSLACVNDFDCATPCGSGDCREGTCTLVAIPGVCIVPAQAQSATCLAAGQGDPARACMRCNPAEHPDRLTPVLLSAGFEDPGLPAGPAVADATGGGISWTVSGARAHGGVSSLYFGDPVTHTYDNDKHVASTAAFPPIELPEGTQPFLSFWLYLDTERSEGFDVLTVSLDYQGLLTEVFRSDAIGGWTGGGFAPIRVDLSAWAGRRVAVVLRFDTIDHGMNAFEGAYVDDLLVSTGCCDDAAGCDDGDPCTDDACGAGGTCEHAARPACCNTPVECGDDDPCTADRCPVPGQACVFDAIPGCCRADADCDDGDPCTRDACAPGAHTCLHNPSCCATDADCVSGDDCLVGRCEGTTCAYEDRCCHSDAECLDSDPCTIDRCDGKACTHGPANIPGCCFPDVADAGFEGDAAGWTPSPPKGGVGWSAVSGARAHAGAGALYFGDPSAKAIHAGASVSGSIVSPPFDLPSETEVTLSFWLWRDTEDYDYTTSASQEVWVLMEGRELRVWQDSYSTPEQSWTQVQVDLSALAGRTIQVRLDVDVSYYEDPWGGGGAIPEGIYVDEFAVKSTCARKACDGGSDCGSVDDCLAGSCFDGACTWANACCSSDLQCDDGNPCTTDACSGSHCSFGAIAGCCTSVADCDDGDACTYDVCPGPGAQCENTAIDGCCNTVKQCDDADACTKDACVAHACTHQNLCCASDLECSDGETQCTLDQCVDQHCVHVATGAPGCCLPDVLVTSFEGGDLAGFTLDPPKSGIGWNLLEGQSASDGTASLYFGDPDVMGYDAYVITGGAAASPELALPAGYAASLAFDVKLDIAYYADADRVVVTWRDTGGGEWVLWRKPDSFSTSAFLAVTVDLSAFAGRTGQVVFHFDSVDTAYKWGEGVFVDDLAVRSACVPPACVADADCDDGVAATAGSCTAGACTWTVGADPECTTDADCDSNDYCITDWCEFGECVHVEDPYCWDW